MTDKTLPLITAILLSSCSGSAAHKSDTTDSIAADTLIADPVEVLTPLPDTIFDSARILRPNIRIIDTITSGIIDDYSDPYLEGPSVLTFRANRYRNADMNGRVQGRPSEIAVDWEFTTTVDNRPTGFGQWGGGTGWTGQPLYVEWPAEAIARQSAHIKPGFSGREIIVGSLSAKVYFIDFTTGRASREPIDVGNPIKGTGSVDPSFNGNLYIGQGVPAQRPFGAMVIDLNSHRITEFTPEDPRAVRRWGAYDSSPVRVGKFLFRPGENGILYKYVVADSALQLHSTMQYTVNGSSPGIESSMVVYRNYGYTADNHGYIVCTNLDNMQPVWVYATGDDNDASPVLIVEDGHPYIYCSSEIDRQGVGTAVFAKLDALTGEPRWVNKYDGQRYDVDSKHFDGGFYASPLPGKGNCSHLIFNNLVLNNRGQNGVFMAVDRATGATVYQVPTGVYSWSSPVGFLNENDDMFILTADCGGRLYLIDGITGEIIDRKPVGSNFESSPVVHGNSAVVGSRGDKIFKISIK